MAGAAIVDADVGVSNEDRQPNCHARPRNIRKRKRLALSLVNLSAKEKEAHIKALQKELDGLLEYYKEVKDQKVDVELSECASRNAVIAVLMEESELPLSRLVDQIYGKLNRAENGLAFDPVTYASVKSSVLFVGQRLMYGVPNADADVLEDDSESCFWCWETRDVKLIPVSVRKQFTVRRTCRRKIHERIMAVSEMITMLMKPEGEQISKQSLIKASEKLDKALTEPDIRLLVDGLQQKNSVDMAKREARREEKLLLKQLERNRRGIENENKDTVHGMQREMLPGENVPQREARKDERCENDGFEKRKQHRKQIEDGDKDQRRQQKEEAELKKKRSLQKQASIMERFLKRSKTSPSCKSDLFSAKANMSKSSNRDGESLSGSITQSMDHSLASSSEISIEDLRKLHFSSWHSLGQSICSNRKFCWGLRQKPKIELFKELKLMTTRVIAPYDELGVEKQVDGLRGNNSDILTCMMNPDDSLLEIKRCCHGKQLLQFDNSHKPAFYGMWPKKSHVVGPRHPFRKDPSLDYDISSDEEWEEEDPGESLSDCDKDEENSLEEGSKSDDESEDGFFVPDGYLSEDEGAQADRLEADYEIDIEGTGSSTGCKDIEIEFCTVLHQQKYLNNLTEHALRKNQPLIITNLMRDKDFMLLSHNLSANPKPEFVSLQALSMRLIPGSSCIEICMDKMQDEDQEICLSNGKSAAANYFMEEISESDLPVFVTAIQTCSEDINKVLESLQHKFPAVSKSFLRSKVREVSNYVDNRLQVKKEILIKLGLAFCPGKSSRGARSITTFFSKRCLPPTGESVSPGETSL
ncbi:chromatin assembly factor 1 subunit FAS1 [Prosopis cineraria]|uniref:chromatin assembly factor 1 subunit FAS1 n=1 Tax=Prosopis cineraria TaxID=364024 RepID=UPI00241034AD|nr:chromatin assembly factor 1 subunit FAS1 [Prosopis cineraria]